MKLDRGYIMELSLRMKEMIESKLASCEEMYDVQVLFWSFRGSLDIDISRKNSDLDLIFVFRNRTKNKVAAIHDIVGYGFDFWGWDIEDAIKTIEINNSSFYANCSDYQNIPLTKEHARGGLTYYSGIYCFLGNKKSGSNINKIEDLKEKLANVMEKRVLISHILAGVKSGLAKLEIEGGMSACDYLYTIWRVLLAEHVYKGGMPGESEIDFLMPLYMDKETMETVNRLRVIYKDSISKHSQFFRIINLNNYIDNKYVYLEKAGKELKPEYETDMKARIEEIKVYVDKITD